jgi:hypothetical protein
MMSGLSNLMKCGYSTCRRGISQKQKSRVRNVLLLDTLELLPHGDHADSGAKSCMMSHAAV